MKTATIATPMATTTTVLHVTGIEANISHLSSQNPNTNATKKQDQINHNKPLPLGIATKFV
jgi:hypothetical protein